MAQEATAVESLPMDDAQRKKMAAFHLAQGQALGGQELPGKGARRIPPGPDPRPDLPGRAGWPTRASTGASGFPDKYLSELQVLAKLGREGHFRAGRDRGGIYQPLLLSRKV